MVWQAVCDHDRAAPALPSCAANSLVWVMAALRQRRQGVGRRGEGSGGACDGHTGLTGWGSYQPGQLWGDSRHQG